MVFCGTLHTVGVNSGVIYSMATGSTISRRFALQDLVQSLVHSNMGRRLDPNQTPRLINN